MSKLFPMLALLAGLTSGNANAIDLDVTPAAALVGIGDTVSVFIDVSDLVDLQAPSLGAYDLDLAFDASVLALQDVTFGSGLDVLGLGSTQFSTPGAGTVNLFELSLDSIDDLNNLQPGDFRLATLSFEVIGIGVSALDASINSFADAGGLELIVATSNGMVTAVPEPSQAMMLLAGLLPLALVALRRR